MNRALYRIIMVDPTGGNPIELAKAVVESVSWELNGWGELSYRIPVLDPQAADAKLLEREVQLWRNGELIWWGIPVAYQADRAAAKFTAFGLLYYFARRYFGPVYSNAIWPLMENGTFEAVPVNSSWNSSTPAPTIAASGLRRYAGSQCIKLTGGGNPNALYYIYQFSPLLTPARSRPLKVTLSAWCYPEGITTYGAEDRGIEIQDNSVTPRLQQWALLNAKVPMNQWTRLETSLELGAGLNGDFTIALFAPAVGSVYYDMVRFTYEQQTGALEGEDWVDDYLRRVFNYGAGLTGGGSTGPGGSPGPQNAWWGAYTAKSNLAMNFFPSSLAAGALTSDVSWKHEDGGNIFDAMSEVFKRDLADIEVTWNDAGTSRGLTPFVPRKGSYKPALALELGRNFTKFDYSVDGRQAANDVRVVGRESGNTKEVGQAGGPYPTSLSGRQFETIKSPPQEVEGQGLIDYATTEERRLRQPVVIPTITVLAEGMLDRTNIGGPLQVGDVVPVRMNHGLIQENDVRRVVKMTLNPGTEEVALVLNAVV